MRERLKPTMVQLSLPIKLKHLQYTLHPSTDRYARNALVGSFCNVTRSLPCKFDTFSLTQPRSSRPTSPYEDGTTPRPYCTSQLFLRGPQTTMNFLPWCTRLLLLRRSLPPRPEALRRRSPDTRVCARCLAVVGVDASVANTSHLVVALRARQTAHSMKIGSADTAFVVRKQRRARLVVRLRYAEQTRCARHRAAGSIAESCVSR